MVDSRESKEGDAIRRRRECLACERRFTTYERIDEVPYMVVKKDGRREKFDREKVLKGLLKACEKRPVSMGKLSEMVNEVESKVSDCSMPPSSGAQPSAAERDAILQWIACGAPNN